MLTPHSSIDLKQKTGANYFGFRAKWAPSEQDKLSRSTVLDVETHIRQAMSSCTSTGMVYLCEVFNSAVGSLQFNPRFRLTYHWKIIGTTPEISSEPKLHLYKNKILISISNIWTSTNIEQKNEIQVFLPIIEELPIRLANYAESSIKQTSLSIILLGTRSKKSSPTENVVGSINSILNDINSAVRPILQAEQFESCYDVAHRVASVLINDRQMFANLADVNRIDVRVRFRTWKDDKPLPWSVGTATEFHPSSHVNEHVENNGLKSVEDSQNFVERPRPEDRVFIALGSNVGDRLGNIEQACREMDDETDIRITRTSALYETEPMYVQDQERFLNGACMVRNLEKFLFFVCH